MSNAPQTLQDVQDGGHELIAMCRDVRCRFQRQVDLRRLIMHSGGWHKLLPERGQVHFSDHMRCPSCKRMGMSLWLEPNLPPPRHEKRPNYRILDWGQSYPYSTFDMIGTADNLFVGRAAYTAAAHFYPDHKITFQQGAFVLGDSKEHPVPEVMTAADFVAMRDAERERNDPQLMGATKPEAP